MNNSRHSNHYSSINGHINDYRRSRHLSQTRNSHRSSSPLRFSEYNYVDDGMYDQNAPYTEYPPYDPNYQSQLNRGNLPYTNYPGPKGTMYNHNRHHSRGYSNGHPNFPYNNYNNTEGNYVYNENDIPDDTYNPNHRFNYPPVNNEETVRDLTDMPIISYPTPTPSYMDHNNTYDNYDSSYYNNTPGLHVSFPSDEGVPMPQPNGEYRKYFYRKKTTKNILLSPEGNLILNCSVPQRALQYAHYRNSEEFLSLRYTAATCDPDDFPLSGYDLRPAMYNRETEIFVVITMYNETDELFCRSMVAIMKNISYLCNRQNSKFWDKDGWKKIVVCIVSDGRTKIHPRVLTTLGIMGIYQDGIMKNFVNGKEVTAHIFEYTTQIVVDKDMKIRTHNQGYVPVQVIFCLKEKNAKKINSHRWFFNAFAPILNPNICILIDVGTKPRPSSFYHLWKAFIDNENVAGACGEICVEKGPGFTNLLNPLVASQNFEYKMSNILDKSLESVFGFISVLPGAFSAYRYVALLDESPGYGPLSAYFKGELLDDSNIFEANNYLAEDRILCFELVSKRNEKWTLKYIKEAKAITDVPTGISEFISQRRRWLNGSFFASIHSVINWHKIYYTNHSIFRKVLFTVQFIYNVVNLIFQWFGLSNFYLAFSFLSTQFNEFENAPFGEYGNFIFGLMREIYICAIVMIFICSLGNRPQASKSFFLLAMIMFALVMLLMIFMTGYGVSVQMPSNDEEWKNVGYIFNVPSFKDTVISISFTMGVYIFSSLLYRDPWHIITSFVQYMLLLPSYINILPIYAFCNINDVSWGTKGANNPAADLGVVVVHSKVDGLMEAEVECMTERRDIEAYYDKLLRDIRTKPVKVKQAVDLQTKKEDYYKTIRTRVLLSWMFCNCLMIITLTSGFIEDYLIQKKILMEKQQLRLPYLTFLFWTIAILAIIRFIGCVIYLSMAFFNAKLY